MGVNHNQLEGGFSMCSAWFVLLASRTSSHITFCEVLHVFSLIGLTEKVYSVHDPWVSGERVVVVRL